MKPTNQDKPSCGSCIKFGPGTTTGYSKCGLDRWGLDRACGDYEPRADVKGQPALAHAPAHQSAVTATETRNTGK